MKRKRKPEAEQTSTFAPVEPDEIASRLIELFDAGRLTFSTSIDDKRTLHRASLRGHRLEIVEFFDGWAIGLRLTVDDIIVDVKGLSVLVRLIGDRVKNVQQAKAARVRAELLAVLAEEVAA